MIFEIFQNRLTFTAVQTINGKKTAISFHLIRKGNGFFEWNLPNELSKANFKKAKNDFKFDIAEFKSGNISEATKSISEMNKDDRKETDFSVYLFTEDQKHEHIERYLKSVQINKVGVYVFRNALEVYEILKTWRKAANSRFSLGVVFSNPYFKV